MTDIVERKVGDLVAEDFRRARVFKNHHIDFCCGGGISLKEACRRKGVDLQPLVESLLRASEETGKLVPQVTAWQPSFLADYIENVHHTFVREHIPAIRAFSQKVAKVHGHARPELLEIRDRFECLATDMESHMAFEEETLFPAIRSGVEDAAGLLETAEREHEEAGDLMKELRELTSDFTPPDWACNTYKALFVSLAEFESDLHIHVHLENNVLFQKARALPAS
jgi:regulator of cell morphogenesis and NO signaling